MNMQKMQTNMLEKQIKLYIQFVMASYETKPEEQKNSLTFFRLISFYRQLKWIEECISQNAYHQAIRESRFILDSIVQAYYIDKRHPTSEMQCKVEIVKELEDLYGAKMIRKTHLKHHGLLEKLYGELCAYVHSSFDELVYSRSEKPEEIASLEFERDPKMMALCMSFVNRTIDAIFFVVLSLFPDILGPKTKLEKIRAIFPKSSKELGLNLTLSKFRRK